MLSQTWTMLFDGLALISTIHSAFTLVSTCLDSYPRNHPNHKKRPWDSSFSGELPPFERSRKQMCRKVSHDCFSQQVVTSKLTNDNSERHGPVLQWQRWWRRDRSEQESRRREHMWLKTEHGVKQRVCCQQDICNAGSWCGSLDVVMYI